MGAEGSGFRRHEVLDGCLGNHLNSFWRGRSLCGSMLVHGRGCGMDVKEGMRLLRLAADALGKFSNSLLDQSLE